MEKQRGCIATHEGRDKGGNEGETSFSFDQSRWLQQDFVFLEMDEDWESSEGGCCMTNSELGGSLRFGGGWRTRRLKKFSYWQQIATVLR